MDQRCPDCGRFAAVLHDVWVTQPVPRLDRAVCTTCHARTCPTCRARVTA